MKEILNIIKNNLILTINVTFIVTFLLVNLFYFHKQISILKTNCKILQEEIDYCNLQLDLMTIDSIRFDRDWFLLKLAIIRVESNHNPNAINPKSKAGGLYQIMPKNGFMDRANEVIGYDKYKDEHRFDIDKATEMFEVVNKKDNPTKSIDRAIFIHNSKAGSDYKEKILKEYNYLKAISYQID